MKVHLRQPRGGRSTDPDDYPPELNAYTLRSPNYLRRKSAELGEAVGAFADKLLGGPTPWYKLRQAYKLLNLGEKYTPLRLNRACEIALSVDLIDVRRLERILKEALEQEAMPLVMVPAPLPGRYARPGSVFAIHGELVEPISGSQVEPNDNSSGNHGGDYDDNQYGNQENQGFLLGLPSNHEMNQIEGGIA
jgi:hypothetical protein